MVMLAAFEVLLHRHTGETDLVVGTPIANRHRTAAEGLVGTLVNTVPVRVRLEPDAPFRALLGAVREAALDALAHQELPFERMVAALGVPRRPGETPLFPVLFDFLNAPMPAPRAGPVRLEPLAFSRRASQFDLALSVLDSGLGQQAGMEYRAGLFEAATVRRLAGHYRAVLEAVAADAAVPVSRIPLLGPEEREEALARAGATCRGRPADVPVPALFEAQALRTPDAVAVVDGAGPLTYRELLAASGALASRLRALGAGPGQRVAVCLERSRQVPVTLLAVLRAGAAYVPIDPRYPAERIAWVLEDAAPVVLVTGEALRASLPVPAGTAVLALDAPPRPEAPVPPPGRAAGPEDVAYVIYTSGSTGRPKGVEVTHLGLSNFLASMARAPGLSAADRLLSVTTISFDIAGLELFLPLVTGARVHLASAAEAGDGTRLAALLRESGATVMQATPATWRMLLDSGWAGAPHLRVLCGGEAMPRDLADLLLARAAEVWNLYGPTETTVWSALWRVGPGTEPVPIGLPVAHTRLYVLDGHGEPTPIGVPGEIHIGGAGVAKGYWRRPELTAERFVPDPHGGPGARMYRTGDLGRFRADGALEYLGRLDHQVKIRGHRVEPGEIEAVLRQHPGVAAAAVVPHQVRPGDLRLAAYWVARGQPGPGRAELREALRRRLPEHMVPSFLVQLEALPLTPNGKLDRRALPPPSGGSAVGDAERVAPRDALEAELAGLFAEVLGTPLTSVRDGFFDLGGHSMLAARLFARIEKSQGVALPLGVLLDHQTVEQLAALVRERKATPAPAHTRFVLPIRPTGRRPPYFCVHGAGGNVLNMHGLAQHLDPDRPFHGVQARGVDGREAPFGSIEEMADAYLVEIRAVQPHGPYFLGGYCGGGHVAYAMAQRLLAEGELVASLTLIDSPGPGRPPPVSRLRRWSQTLLHERGGALLRRLQAKWQRDRGRARSEATLRQHLAHGEVVPHELRDFWLTNEFIRAAAHYRMEPYPGRLLVFRARDGAPGEPEDLGWKEMAGGGLVVEAVPGDHHSLAQEPHVRVLGARLEAALQAAEAAVAQRAAS
jgi:amino acid adenylation domain-containing protein